MAQRLPVYTVAMVMVCSWRTVSSVAPRPTDQYPTPYQDPIDSPQGPIFISEPENRVVFANTQGVTVHCTAYGRPAPVLDWVKANGSDVNDVPGLLEILPNNSLHFPPFSEEDFRVDVHTGSYRCMATNVAGVIVSRTVTINAVLIGRYRTYNVRVNDIYVIPGNTAVFKCSIDPYYVRDHVHVTSWKNSGNTVTSDDRMSVLPSGELLIRDVRTEDSYLLFRCVSRNKITGKERESDPATLYVIDPVNSPPTVIELPQEVHASHGNQVELPCTSSGYPTPTYAWSRDGLQISPDQTRVSQNGGNLVIESVTVRDSGEYECTATNTLGKTTTTVRLIVEAPLSAHIEPASQTIDVGHSARFNCTVYGHPVHGVQWYKDGHMLAVDGTRITTLANYTLRIAQVERRDRGMYQCLVWNARDNTEAASQLSIGVAKPHILEAFEDRTISVGRSVSLKCVSSGNPTPVLQWTMDDSPIPLEDKYVVGSEVTKDGDVISYLNITSVRVEDGGQFGCTASNGAGSVHHLGRVNVYGVPYIRPMSNVTAVANEVLVLKCYVSGYPIETITWQHGQFVLPMNHRQQLSREGTLTVHNVTRDHDEGEYSCDARNAGGQGMRRSFFISVMEPPKIDQFRFPAGRKKGDRVSVTCVVSSGDLPISINWLWNGKPVPVDIGIEVQKLGTFSSLLSISHADPRHNGNFTCSAANKVATANHTTSLHVKLPPRWVTPPANSFVVVGSSVVLDCLTSGDPKPSVLWQRASDSSSKRSYRPINATDFLLGPPARVQRMPNGSLVIRDAGIADAGYYLCHSSNGVGADLSKVVYLTVHVPARFTPQTAKNYSVDVGSDVTMECVAEGDQPLSLSWSFNSGNLDWKHNGRLAVSYFNTADGKGSRLTIKPATREDSGFYVCNAKNIFGSDSLPVYLTVYERPDPPIGIIVNPGTNRDVKIEWTPGFNGNLPITSFIVEAKLDEDDWQGPSLINMTVPGTDKEVMKHNLRPAYTYNIRVRAVNDKGVGEASVVATHTTQTEAPSGAPEDTRAIATGSQSMVVAWMPPPKEQRNGVIEGYYIGYKVYNDTAPYMYIMKTVEDLFTDEEPSAADGSPLFSDHDSTGQRVWMTLLDMKKFTQYTLHVQAFNEKGAGPRSEDIVVFTLEDVPSQPPQNVQTTPLSSQSVMVMWGPPPLYTLHGILQGYKVFYRPVNTDEDESDSISITTNKLSTAIFGLQKYTNYSIQVLAYTRKGEGLRSLPVFVRTEADLPERPADIKAVPAGPDAIFVTWKPPVHPNGQIMKYILHMRDMTNPEVSDLRLNLPASQLSHTVTNLSGNHEYGFRVGANTVVGDGELTYEYKVSTSGRVGARIASFSGEVHAHWHHTILLPCQAVGEPAPTVTWRNRSQPIEFNDRVQLMSNGSLLVKDIRGSDAANYTCRVENQHGADEMTIVLIVQAPPKPPAISVTITTSSTIQVSWRSGSNGGSKIRGFVVTYKRQHGDWVRRKVDSSSRAYTATDLRCGTAYSFNVKAFNDVGEGVASDTISVHTNGSRPIMPAQSLMLTHVNSTYILLDLSTWQSGGCDVTDYDIHYQYWGDQVWSLVEAHVDPEKKKYRVDLQPATWYVVRVTAYNEAGSTECLLKFSTKTYEGNTIEPVRIVRRYQVHFYQQAYVMVPLCLVIVVLVVVSVGVGLYCRRRHKDFAYKAENASNLRKDLTTESFLMSDVEKPSNLGSPDHTYGPDPSRPPNNVDTGSSEDAGSRGSCVLEEDGTIKPYATTPGTITTTSKPINTNPPNVEPRNTYDHELDPDLDELPPPPLDMLQETRSPKAPSHHNGGLLLTPRPLADLDLDSDRYHGDGYTPSFRLPIFHLPSLRLNRNMVAPEKGRQRQSIVSNVSSNHDELVQALGHLPHSHPTLPSRGRGSSTQPKGYGTTPHPHGRHGSVMSEGTPATPLRDFTTSPARPNEHRRAVCEVPIYDLVSGDGSTDSRPCPTPPPPPPPLPEKPARTLSSEHQLPWIPEAPSVTVAGVHHPHGTWHPTHSRRLSPDGSTDLPTYRSTSNIHAPVQTTNIHHTESLSPPAHPEHVPITAYQTFPRTPHSGTLLGTPQEEKLALVGDTLKRKRVDRSYRDDYDEESCQPLHTCDDEDDTVDDCRQPLQGGDPEYRV